MKVSLDRNKQQDDLISTEFLTTRLQDIDLIMSLVGDLICPIGVLLPSFFDVNDEYYLTTINKRFILLQGQTVSISDYPKLYSVYKDRAFANVSLANKTFVLPDMRDKTPYGLATGGVGSTLGGSFGTKGQAHYHGMGTGADLNITTGGDHSHGGPFGLNLFVTGGSGGTATGVGAQQSSSTGSATHTHSSSQFAGRIGTVTGGQDGDTALYPPGLAVNWITRYK